MPLYVERSRMSLSHPGGQEQNRPRFCGDIQEHLIPAFPDVHPILERNQVPVASFAPCRSAAL